MSTERTIHCRECGAEFDVRCSYTELPVQCEECKSYDTYSEVGAVATQFIHNRFDACGWSKSNYTKNKVIDLGEASPLEKRQARELQQAHKENAIHGDK